eukprot:CAMPEP_0174335540 /NCGR_PEP_ID=MMETSP0810-20121108/20865_1 /TAXON_ID=73025 ORGANISM="Eutreptiella gymnastica-like, Strain CCMP1594" /NCGR_SAMPLE_ID=MMETSP0810 /ASSEMBLY_ACC=CAM_ASM_000659 /LENGTH=59 /DNA_ID=CAMNT_0015453981 /DNA_START=45 /DNA_END=224 /DNA_ORIENTATION=-
MTLSFFCRFSFLNLRLRFLSLESTLGAVGAGSGAGVDGAWLAADGASDAEASQGLAVSG